MNLVFLLTLNLSPKMSYDGYYVLICSLILPITWILSIVISSCNKKRRILTMKRKMLEMTKDYNPSENNITFEFKSKIKRNNTKSCRKYITARKRGKLTKIGNKARTQPTFLAAYNVVNVASSSIKKYNQRSYTFDSDSQVIGVDNHASRCMSNNLSDFITELKPANNTKVKGAGGNLQVKGIGTLKWRIQDDQGNTHEIYIKNALYIPDLPISLLSPQHWSQQAKDNNPKKDGTWCATYATHCVLHWDQQRYTKTVQHDKRTNTPRMYTLPRSTKYRKQVAALDTLANTAKLIKTVAFNLTQEDQEIEDIIKDKDNTITEQLMDYSPHNSLPTPRELEIDDDSQANSLQGEFLRWHYRLGHMSYPKMKLLAILRLIPRSLLTVRPPLCSHCKIGSMTRKPWRVKGKENKGRLRQVNAPGMCVSVDQLESRNSGYIGVMRGFMTKQRYTCATVFVDHHSDLTFTYLQKSLTVEDTVKAKRAFEAFSRRHGVKIQHYHSDNGRFADKEFIKAVTDANQTISFCGAYAHFQNGKAEKRIRDLQDKARTALLHSVSRWTKASSTHLWPYALAYVTDLRNHLPLNSNAESPMQVFSQSFVNPRLSTFHTFGCPVYSLDTKLQAGGSIPKWEPRCSIGLYLGNSPRHARTVSLVLNLTTGRISPQFHVKHDEFFETINTKHDTTISKWKELAGLSKHHDNQQSKTDLPKTPAQQSVNPSMSIPDQSLPNTIKDEANDDFEIIPNDDHQEDTFSDYQQPAEDVDNNDHEEIRETNEPSLRRSNRTRIPTTKFLQSVSQHHLTFETIAFNSYYEAMHEDDYELQDQMTDPIAFLATNNKDTLYYHEAMKAPDREEFLKAMQKEFDSHMKKKHYELIERDAVPDGEDVLDAVWSMKRKRNILTNMIYKYKSRLNIHGGQQEYAKNFYETYSPVVHWFSIRLLLIHAMLFRWSTRQVDFTMAFPQADIEFPLYMKIPPGIKLKGKDKRNKVLELKKNLYGQKQGSRIWFLHLANKLRKLEYEQSEVDECIFYKGDLIIFFYVDDMILLCPDSKKIDEAIKQLKQSDLELEDQGDIADYIGINFTHRDDGTIIMSQPQLIDQIVKDLQLKPNAHLPSIPALASRILQREENAKPCINTKFHYRSVVGKLNFLEKGTRPDIAYATHQVARFCEDPREAHVKAVLHLGKYLKHTRSDGIILNPNRLKSIEVYADADFAGNWNINTAEYDASTAKSRSGYIVLYAGCPIIWSSKLQTQVALSTTEAEYVSLSQALREVVPVMNLIKELKERKITTISSVPKVYCKAFEDNSGALELARSPKLRPRTKHINNTYHHFREYVRNRLIQLFPIGTEFQVADIFTKPLSKDLFVKFRKCIMGW